MKTRRFCPWMATALVCLSWGVTPVGAQTSPDTARYTLGDALRSAVVPNMTVRRYQEYVPPGQKGIVQRSLFDFSNVKRNIQIAFVIDATNTMRQDIESLKKNLVGFVQGVRSQARGVSTADQVFVEFAVVVYRDFWKEYDFEANCLRERRQRAAEVLTRGERARSGFFVFDRDLDQILNALESVSLETGDPGFPEQVDRGLYAALTELEWSPGDDVTRLVIVAGDAPPWKEEYAQYEQCPRWWTYWEDRQPTPQPLRGHTSSDLTKLAESKRISVYSIACNSGVDDPKTFQHFRPDLQGFFRSVAESTGGTFLDLDNQWTVQSLQEATDTTQQVMLELPNISAKEIEQRKSQGKLRGIAVLPPMALNDMKFSAYEDERLDFYTAFLERLRRVEGRNIPSSRTLRQAWSALAQKTSIDESSLPELARNLNVDFVVWGQYTTQDDVPQVELVAFDNDGKIRIDAEPVRGPLYELPERAFLSLRQAMALHRADAPKADAFVQVYDATQMTSAPQPLGQLAHAYGLLEDAILFATGNEEGVRKTKEAIKSLNSVIESGEETPLAFLLLANCYFNLQEQETAEMNLKRARKLSQSLPEQDAIRLEIEADHLLFVQKDPLKAAEAYERLAAGQAGRKPDSVRRALWMLAGIYLGDWGADAKLKDHFDGADRRKLAKNRILELLVDWPDSDEATYYHQYVMPPVERRDRRHSDPGVRYADIHRVIVPAAGRTRFAQTLGSKKAAGGS